MCGKFAAGPQVRLGDVFHMESQQGHHGRYLLQRWRESAGRAELRFAVCCLGDVRYVQRHADQNGMDEVPDLPQRRSEPSVRWRVSQDSQGRKVLDLQRHVHAGVRQQALAL